MCFPDGNAGSVEMLFQVIYRVSTVMKYGSGQRGIGLAFGKDSGEMVGFAGPPGSDHRDVRGARNGFGQRAVEARLHAISIHRSEQDLARPQFFSARSPLDGVDAFIVAASARVNMPFAGALTPRVDRQHDGLRAEFPAQFGNQFGPPYRRRC